MIIILEACDGQGKTTLAKQLCIDFKAKFIHTSAPKTKNAYSEYIEMLKNIDISKNYVFDRAFHGELVYGPVFRNKSTVSLKQLKFLENIVKKHGVFCIYCWTDIENTRSVFANRGELFTKIEHVPILHEKFQKIIKKSALEWSTFDWRTDSYISLVNKIKLKLIKPC